MINLQVYKQKYVQFEVKIIKLLVKRDREREMLKEIQKDRKQTDKKKNIQRGRLKTK